jgi:hypothetical protein
MIATGGVACSPGTASVTGEDRDAASADVLAAYDGPFDLPEGNAVTVPLKGCGGPGYAAEFKVGSQAFQLTIDTGSGTLALASASCDNCDVSPVYEPGSSAVDQQKSTFDNYALGGWTGEVYSDSVTLEGVDEKVKMDLAAIGTQSGFFKDGGCAFGTVPFAPQGIVGFGPAAASVTGTDAFWSKLTQGGESNVFAVEVCSSGGLLMVGGVDPVRGDLRGPALYTPILDSAGSLYYSVTVSDLQLGGKSLGFSASDFGATAVDTGSSVLVLLPDVFHALASKIEDIVAFSTDFDGGSSWLGTADCFSSSLSPAEIDSMLPALSLSFPRVGGGTFSLDLKATDSYLPPTTEPDGSTYYCSGILQGTAATGTVLGTSAMLGHLVIFDLADGKIGFAPQAFCP